MKIEIEKETKKDGTIFYNIICDGLLEACETSWGSAMAAVRKLEDGYKAAKKEIIWSRTLSE